MMRRTREGLIKAVEQSLAARRKSSKYQRKVDAFNAARKRSELKFKRRVFERALVAVEFDHIAAAELQKRDQESIAAFLASCKKEALNQAVAVDRRHAALIKQQISSFGRPSRKRPSGNEPQGVVLKTADSIVSDISSATTSIAPYTNTTKFLLSVQEHHQPWQFVIGKGDLNHTDWHFSWTAPMDGLMSYTALVLLSGNGFLWSDSGCFIEGFADATLSVFTTFSTYDNEGRLYSVPTYWPSFNPLINRKIDRGMFDSVGAADFFLIENQDLFPWSSYFPVQLYEPVLVTVSMDTSVFCNNYEGQIDLSSKDYGANVPFVLLKFQPLTGAPQGSPKGPLHR